MYGITFNGKHSFNDFGLYVEEQHISPPAKKKIIVPVPYMNAYYDFSTVGSNGEQVYDPRPIVVKLGLLSNTREQLYVLYSQILEWLEDVGQSQLIFDFMPDYYFLAEVQGIPTWDEFVDNGDLEVTFIAYPFKQGVNQVGEEAWDTFNFETDYMQDVEFDVVGTKTVTIYNPGRVVSPVINCSAGMVVQIGDYSTMLNQNDNSDWGFKLKPGENTISIIGIGHIKFVFRKETI